MDPNGKCFLVIGGAGFIGSHVVDQLIAQDVRQVLVYDNFTRGSEANLGDALRDPRVRLHEPRGDILQPEVLARAMQGMDGVFHLAALWLLHCEEFPRSACDVNIGGTFNVLEACRDAGVQRLVFSSSASVYGNAASVPMTEEHPFHNRTMYGATKVAGEQLCRAFCERYRLPYVALRYMNVYGARQDARGAYTSVIMKVLDRVDRGMPPIVYGDGSQSCDFVDVTDCARANLCAMASEEVDRCYNVGTGVATSVRGLVELLLELAQSNLPIQYQEEKQTFVTHRVGSTELAQREIGFEARVALREGLQKLIEWRRACQPVRSQ